MYRHFVFSTHYRKQLNMNDDWLESSRPAVNRVGVFARRLSEATAGTPALAELAVKAEQAFVEALFDDLNGPEAMAALFVFITDANRELDDPTGSDVAALQRARAAFKLMDGVLDLVPEEPQVDADEAMWIEEQIAARKAARAARDFKQADAIRDEITARGFAIEDSASGTRWWKRF